MKKKKHQKHSPERSKAKYIPAAKDYDPDNQILKSLVSHVFSNGWVQNSGVAFLLSLVAFIAAIMTRTQIKAAAIAVAGVGTLFVWIVAISIWRYAEAENPPFAIAIETLWQGSRRDNTQIFCVRGRFFSPVPIVMFLRIVNRQDIPATISTMRIEVQLKKGFWFSRSQWLKTTPVTEDMPLVWVNPPPARSRRMRLLGSRIESGLTQGPIPPHQTVQGWILLDAPARYDEAPSPHMYRISIKDTEGHEFSVLDQGPTETGNIFIGTTRGFDIENETDIGTLQVKHLSDSEQNSN